MLELIRARMDREHVRNIEPIRGTASDPKLPPAGVDLILMVDVYHEFSFPWEMTAAMLRALKPGGKLVFVEYRKEDPTVPIKLVHKMTEKQVLTEMSAFPLRWAATLDPLPRQHVIILER
jgi:ubiquinone/menaquinone biosynthesis C-methylase UbiE